MSVSNPDQNYNLTKEDLRKAESEESKKHGGTIPKDSEVSGLKSLVDSKSNTEKIDEVKANLPLPDQPVGGQPTDWSSLDARSVNVGSGGVSSDFSKGDASSAGLRGPATADSSVRTDGETWKTNTAPDSNIGRS